MMLNRDAGLGDVCSDLTGAILPVWLYCQAQGAVSTYGTPAAPSVPTVSAPQTGAKMQTGSWTLADIYEAEAQRKQAEDDAKATAASGTTPAPTPECGFFCELKKYGTGAMIGMALAGVALVVLLVAKK